MRSAEMPDNIEKREQDQSWHHQQTQLGYLIQLSYSFYVFTREKTVYEAAAEKKHFKV